MIPIVNLATPLFAMAMMVHMHKRLSGGPSMIEAEARLPSPFTGRDQPPSSPATGTGRR